MSEDLKKELKELESLHKLQVENGRHYFWEEGNDNLANEWQMIADGTKKKIIEFKEKHGIRTPNWWE